MIENIKTLWALMLKETKNEAVKALSKEESFKVSDEIYIRQTWISKGNIPETCQERVVEIFQNCLKAQNEKIYKVL